MSAPQSSSAPTDKEHNVTVEGDVESHLHPTPSWQVADHPMPTGHEEIWRFTPIAKFATVLAEQTTTACLDWTIDAPESVQVDELDPARLHDLAETPQDRISMMAAANSTHAPRHIVVPAEAELDSPVEITLTGTGVEEAAFQNVVVEIGHNARATVIVRYRGTAQLGENWTFRVGDEAHVVVLFIQEWEAEAVHGAQIAFEIGRDAVVRTAQASFGGKAVRVSQAARYTGPGGDLTDLGAYFVDADQHVEHRLFVDHNEPRSVSHVDYRGCLQGQDAHSVWIGDVLIRPTAEDIETFESNKNLVLTEGCRADAVPNLEIQTGRIRGAGHSASTGRFDADQLFYLQARGIDEVEARRLVVHGFFTDIVRRIGVESVSDELIERIESELVDALGTSESDSPALEGAGQ